MHVTRRLPVLVCVLATVCGTASAGQPASLSHKDWRVQCDNTRTCRAAGYQAEDSDSEPVSMLITREAGPDTLPSIRLQVHSETSDASLNASLQLQLGKTVLVLRVLKDGTATVPPAHVPRLMAALLDAEAATVRAGEQTWTLSLAGVKAVLLKMDDAQQRLDTPGALVRRGRKPEAGVLPALPAPTILAVIPPANRPGDVETGKRAAKAALKDVAGECNNDGEALLDGLQVQRLDAQRLLVSAWCTVGAYNDMSIHWIVSTTPPHRRQRIDADGEFNAATGAMQSRWKGRGLADCLSSQAWQFDGQRFVLSEVSDSGLCRGFPGGAWDMPSFVSRVLPADAVKR